MPPITPKHIRPPLLSPESGSGLARDITWDRPIFRPPLLQNLRVIFDPLPFTAQRVTASPRTTARR